MKWIHRGPVHLAAANDRVWRISPAGMHFKLDSRIDQMAASFEESHLYYRNVAEAKRAAAQMVGEK